MDTLHIGWNLPQIGVILGHGRHLATAFSEEERSQRGIYSASNLWPLDSFDINKSLIEATLHGQYILLSWPLDIPGCRPPQPLGWIFLIYPSSAHDLRRTVLFNW